MQYVGAHPEYGVALTFSEERFSQAEFDYYYKRLTNIVVPNQVRLLDFFRSNGLTVIYMTAGVMLPDGSDRSPTKLRSYPHIEDFEYKILEEIKPSPNELVIRKITHRAFTSSGIDQILRNMGIVYLVIAGVGTNVCVETTARDAADRGYRCVMVEDACATFIEELHDATLLTFALWFGKVKSTTEVINQLEHWQSEPLRLDTSG